MRRRICNIVIQFGLIPLVIILLAMPIPVSAQRVTIPFTRNDSAARIHNDSSYRNYLSLGNLKEAARNLDKNAMLFWLHNYYDTAVTYFHRSLVLNERLGNQNGMAGINSNLAFIYADMGNYPQAYDYFEMTLAVRRAKGDNLGVISALVNESVVLNNMDRYEEAVKKLEEGLHIARQGNDENQMRSIYGMLTETYQKWGKADKAMYYYEYYRSFNDYVANKRVQKAEERLELQRVEQEKLILENRNKELELAIQERENAAKTEQLHELTVEQRELIDSLAQAGKLRSALEAEKRAQALENKQLLQEKRNAFKTLLGILVIVGLLVVFLIFIIIDRRRRMQLAAHIQEQNKVLAEQRNKLSVLYDNEIRVHNLLAKKNDEILSSIQYSKNIQDAVLGHNTPLSELCKDTIFYNRPLAIVSGDFYYTRELPSGEIIIVLGDCTGHGVPGAFLTILGIMTLDKAIFDHKLSDCNEILRTLDTEIRLLNQKNEIPYHSMEISLCIIDKKKKKLQFAGSRTGMLLTYENGKTECINGSFYILGHRSALFGGRMPLYPVYEFTLTEGMWFYIFSDGICDQFNEVGERFSKRRVKQIVEDMQGKSGDMQYDYVKKTMEQWQGRAEQTDDILFIGFRPI
ncbi:MAG: tetratricopeptide repeat protein [Bacteroides sp.]